MRLKKFHDISDLMIDEVTLCKSPARGGSKFLLMKSKETRNSDLPTWDNFVEFVKVDKDKQLVIAYALDPDDIDSQDDTISVEEVEKACHKYLEIMSKGDQAGTGVGYEHKVFEGVGYPVESCVDRDGSVAKSMGVPEDKVKPGGWLLVTKVSDEYWPLVKSGEITGYSVGGVGKRIENTDSDVTKSDTKSMVSLLDELIQKFKGKKKMALGDYKPQKFNKATAYNDISVHKAVSYDELNTTREITEELIKKTWTLYDAIWSIMDDDGVINKASAVSESVTQYLDDVRELGKIEKKLNIGEDEMNPEQIEKLDKLSESVEKLTATMTELAKDKETKEDPANTTVNNTTVNKEDPTDDNKGQVEALSKTVKELEEKLAKLAKVPDDRHGDDGSDTDTTLLNKSIEDMTDIQKIQLLSQDTPLSFMRKGSPEKVPAS